MDNFQRALRDNSSECLECDEFHWCRNRVWVGEPKDCPIQLKK